MLGLVVVAATFAAITISAALAGAASPGIPDLTRLAVRASDLGLGSTEILNAKLNAHQGLSPGLRAVFVRAFAPAAARGGGELSYVYDWVDLAPAASAHAAFLEERQSFTLAGGNASVPLAGLELLGVSGSLSVEHDASWLVRLLKDRAPHTHADAPTSIAVGDEAFMQRTVVSGAGTTLTIVIVGVRVGAVIETVTLASRAGDPGAAALKLGSIVAARIASATGGATGPSGATGASGPAAPTSVPPWLIDPGGSLTGLACPSTSQCTAVDHGGLQITFDPITHHRLRMAPIDNGDPLFGVACPSATQCTTVSYYGREVTFNPVSAGGEVIHRASGNTLFDVACPTTDSCTAVGFEGEVTFNPETPAASLQGAHLGGKYGLAKVACASLTRCVALSPRGFAISFNPQSATVVTRLAFAAPKATFLAGVACPGESECVVVGNHGHEARFDPAAAGGPVSVIDPAVNNAFNSVSCPSTAQCTGTDGFSNGHAVTFNPGRPSSSSGLTTEYGQYARTIACPSTTQCTTDDDIGNVVTFDPHA